MSLTLAAGAATGAVAAKSSGMLSSLPTAISIFASAWMNVQAHKRIAAKNLEAQRERDERLAELQERQRLEDKRFQLARDVRHERFQIELEAQRMSFQEHLELRRLQFQTKMEEQREKFQLALTERQMQNQREIAQYQAMAMRETQILVARESAQNMLSNQMVLEALKTFPLNISPLVLLNNRPHTLSSLLRFTVDERLADGYYCAKSIRLLKKILENPELMELPMNEEVEY